MRLKKLRIYIMKIGFDFDGTITKNPFIFKILVESLQKDNDLYIISGTSYADKRMLLSELNSFSINENYFKEIILREESSTDVMVVSEWKKHIIDKYKIRLYFENRKETAIQINDLCNVCLFM